MIFFFGGYTILEFIAVFTALIALIIIWNNTRVPEVKWLMALEFFVLIWSVCYAFELGAIELKDKLFWARLSYIGIAFVPLSFFCFSLFFTRRIHKLRIYTFLVLTIIPVITLLLTITANSHNYIWESVTPVKNKTEILNYEHGIWFWVFWVYSQMLILTGVFVLFRYTPVKSSDSGYKYLFIVIATLLPVSGNIMYVLNINPLEGFDITTLAFAFSGLIMAFGIKNLNFFNIVPFARNRYLDTMDDGVIVVNSMGFIEDYNSAVCRIFGLNNNDFMHRKFNDVFSGVKELENYLNESNKQIFFDTLFGDTIKYYQAQTTPIYGKNGKETGRFLLIRDVTSMKKVEKELINTNVKLLEEIENREKLIDDLDSFAHTVAHDLRNSIGAIINSSSILKENIQDNNLELLAEMADLIKESATKTMHVMNEILILGTVSHQQVEKKPFDMFKVFNEAVKQLRSVIEEKNAEIHVPEKWPIVLGNSTWIEEVWINYLSNALKYGGNPPIVKVGYESVPGNMIKFWINDNGEGLSEEDQEKLYKKSTRLDPHRAEGYGFGLSIIKRIITKLGGEVGVTCNPKEKNGATFFFTLPLATRHKK